MKKLKTIAAALSFFTCAATALASNPFVDVPQDSWAYQSVRELVDAGVIQGVSSGYFQGNRPITRYEAAEMTAKAMAHMNDTTKDQQADIRKLAHEFSSELDALGVRVDQLENRVGKVFVSGDVRLRYRHQSGSVSGDKGLDYRTRIRATVSLDSHSDAEIGASSGDRNFSDNSRASEEDTTIDRANVNFHF